MNRAGEALAQIAREKLRQNFPRTFARNLRDLGFRQSEFEVKLTRWQSLGPTDSIQSSCFSHPIPASR